MIFLLSTCPDQATAKKLATLLVESGLVACVNIVPGIMSVYRWEGKIHEDQEVLLMIKSQQRHFEQIRLLIEQHHPYDVPEVIASQITHGSPSYLEWLEQQTQGNV